MARRGREHNLLTNLDVTPLVDLTFILLIVFMITAPAMESHIKIPTMTADAKETKKEMIVISLDDRGYIYLNKDQISMDELVSRLSGMQQEGKIFAVRADGNRTWKEVIALMRAAKEAGISNVDLVTKNEQ